MFIGPSRLYAEMSLQFTNISWGEEYNDPESDDREMLLQVLTDEVCKQVDNFFGNRPSIFLLPIHPFAC